MTVITTNNSNTNEIEVIKSQLNDINNKRIKYQTLKEQAIKQCKEIEEKYNIKSIEELEAKVNSLQSEYDNVLQKAQEYITKTNEILSDYSGII